MVLKVGLQHSMQCVEMNGKTSVILKQSPKNDTSIYMFSLAWFYRVKGCRSSANPLYEVCRNTLWHNKVPEKTTLWIIPKIFKDLQEISRWCLHLSRFEPVLTFDFSHKKSHHLIVGHKLRPGAETGRHRFMVGWGSLQGFLRLESEKRILQCFPEGSLSFFVAIGR